MPLQKHDRRFLIMFTIWCIVGTITGIIGDKYKWSTTKLMLVTGFLCLMVMAIIMVIRKYKEGRK